jgi:hypothetical protein
MPQAHQRFSMNIGASFGRDTMGPRMAANPTESVITLDSRDWILASP